MDINYWRDEIDQIDQQLLELLNRRSQCAIEIGKIKHREGLPIYSPAREAEILEKVTKSNQGPLQNDAVRRLFERIIDESRRAERLAQNIHEVEP